MKKTLVLGASPNPERYAYAAVKQLVRYGHEVVAIGNRAGEIDGIAIAKDTPPLDDIHTVSLYLSAANQPAYYDYILGINPRRIIFNPGTENPELSRLARERGIETLPACTLVMLSIGNY
ncbi:MAG TPA: CoA-binding protein [Saprospiraceae bacterium]|nr:CoA-binding protein [Saprospiraceae bacterium]HMP26263.1 CoA-binding protein [Saprospiraceae bacterium]